MDCTQLKSVDSNLDCAIVNCMPPVIHWSNEERSIVLLPSSPSALCKPSKPHDTKSHDRWHVQFISKIFQSAVGVRIIVCAFIVPWVRLVSIEHTQTITSPWVCRTNHATTKTSYQSGTGCM